jgi:predicted amidohydrolase YtcJ
MQADLVLYNGDIHTMDAVTPRAQAIAIAGNRVLAVGSDDEIRALLAPKGEVVDLRGRTVVPGFTDAHLHFMSYGLSLKQVDLAEVPTLEEALARVAARAAKTPAGHWLEGRGWDHSLWEGGAFAMPAGPTPARWNWPASPLRPPTHLAAPLIAIQRPVSPLASSKRWQWI